MWTTIHLVFVEGRWGNARFKRVAVRRPPKLREGEISIQLEIQVPNTIFQGPKVKVQVPEEAISKPEARVIKATQ